MKCPHGYPYCEVPHLPIAQHERCLAALAQLEAAERAGVANRTSIILHGSEEARDEAFALVRACL